MHNIPEDHFTLFNITLMFKYTYQLELEKHWCYIEVSYEKHQQTSMFTGFISIVKFVFEKWMKNLLVVHTLFSCFLI